MEGSFALGLIRDGFCGMGNGRTSRRIADHVRHAHRYLPETSTDHLQDSDPVSVLRAGADKEITYLTRHDKPLHPFNRMAREHYDYQKQLPSVHLNNLHKYLEVAPYLISNNINLSREIIRYPDLSLLNIFVSPN